MSNEFCLDLIGCLHQAKSKKQINADIRQLEKVINMLRITGTLAKGDTKKEINNYIKNLGEKLNYVKLKGKIDDKNLKREIENSLHNMTFKEIDALNVDGNKAKLKIRKVVADMKAYAEKTPISVNVRLKKEKLNNDLTAFLNKNTKIRESSVLLAESERIRELIDSVDDNDKGSLRNATDAFSLFKSEVVATGYATKSTTDKIKGMLSHVTKIGSFFGLASMAVNNFRKSLSTLKGNDTIIVEISKTSEMTKKQLEKLNNESFKTASKYGQLSSNFLLGVQEMARSGYEDLSKELAELSLLAQSAGNMTAENANNYLLATDTAYKYSGSVEKLNAALDGASYISNRNSASLTDIADATRVSASFAVNAGVAIDELTAAEATMIATTKRSGSEIGRAFRSIVLNLQQVSGEFDGEIIDEEQLKKVEARCHSLGVELEYMKDGVPTLRNTMEVLKELAEVYNSLPDYSAEKQGLISDLGGKYHANALSALLSHWNLYEKMLSEFSQGTGSALEEAEKIANSWEGRLNSLQNSFDSFVNTLTNKDAIKSGISFFDRLIQGAEELTDAIGEIPVILTALNSALVATNKDYGITQIWNKDKRKIDLQGNIFGIDITNIKNMKKHFEEAEEAIAKWNKELLKGNIDINDFGEAIVQNNAQFKKYLSTCSKDAPASLKGYKAHLKAAGVSTDALRLKTILLNSAITMLGGWAIQLLVTGLYQLFQVSNNVAEKAQELGNAFKSTKSDIEDNKSKIEDLHKTINDSGSSISDVTEARKNLMVIQDELIEKFGYEEEAIKNITDAINGQADALDKLTEKQWQEAKNKFNDADFWGGIGNWLDGYDTNIDRMIHEMENYYAFNTGFALDMRKKEDRELAKVLENAGYWNSETGFMLHGMLESVYDDIINIQELLKDYDVPHSFSKALQDEAKQAKQSLEKYSSIWDTYILRDVILKNEDWAKSWNDVNEAYSDYRKAFESGDKDAQNNAIGEFAQSLNEVLDDSKVKDSVKEYFQDMYPAMTREAEKWSFRFKILPEYDIHALNGKTQADILEMLQTDGFQYGEQTFNSLLRLAGDYGIIIGDDSEKINQLLDLLVEWEILQSEILENSADINTEPISFSTQLTNSTDSLDKFQSAVKSAADAYATLLSGNYSSSELLDSIQAINKAASDMGKSIDWESIAASDNPLKAIQDEIESISNTYAESVLSGAGIDTDSDFGKMLANIVQQAYEVEAEFAGMNAQLDRSQSSYKTLTDVLESYNETGYISLDNLQSLLTADENLITMLEVENGQLVINQAAYENLVATQLLEFKAKLNDAAAAEIEALAKDKAEKATNNNADASNNAVEKLDAETKAFNRNTSAAIANAIAKAEEASVSEEEIQKVLDKYEDVWNAAMDNYSTDFPTFMNGAKSSGEAAGKSAGEAFTDALDKELTALDKKMEAGYIDFNDYIQARLNLIENYYKQGKHSADEYYSYLEKHYKQELSYRDKVVSAVTRRIDTELDALKQQKDDVESIYKEQIESLEKEKTLLEEANKERQRQIDLQKSLYDLERARNQRTKLVYSEDNGMHYVADDQSIRDAQKNVDDARYDIKIAGIDKSISNLEEIRNTKTNAIDEMISDLEAYKDAWSDITSAYEEEQENLIAAQILGADWEDAILNGSNGRLDVLNAFKNEYISIQQAMADAAWESANEQIKAVKEAEYTIRVNVETNGGIPDVNDTSTPEEGTITLPDGRMLTPYDPDRDTSGFGKLYKAWTAYYGNVNKNVEEIQKTLSHHVMMEHNQQMQEEVNRFINNSSSVVNNRSIQPVINGDINITCPGITSQEVARQVGTELNNIFQGFHNYAEQQSRKR